ncbi:pyrroloquinoline quinone-dependent dehydrogenase [Sphingomonas sp. OTU376]|uniref:pyrroloquinoline quinone-dependent dehydrogenase n=1 Tax=Sphingomonas sp. OTU376 TaxID=3043863 RepID=UPI00313E27C1
MTANSPGIDRRTLLASGAVILVAGAAGADAAPIANARKAEEWPVYGATNAATKYSPLDQIHSGNVAELEIAWEWISPDSAILAANPELKPGEFQATALMVDGTLYVSTAMSQVAAIDPATGKTLWVHDPGSWRRGYPTSKGFQHRGVAYWRDGPDRRILIATGDNRLIALDARSGMPVRDFGKQGEVDLSAIGLQRPVTGAPSSLMGVTSPPLICRDVVVVGQYIDDRTAQTPMPAGDVRGFDVRSGKLLWTFHTVPQPTEFGADSWEQGSAARNGNANVWAPMSADDELGMVYLPCSCPTNNFYGGERPGDNLFGNSLIALDARTGKRRWHFQIVHHDLWDYDLPCAPNLIDVTVDGARVPAVAQVTKHGFCFAFDRRTGRPLWPIEERAVPQSAIASEHSAATQPFPTRPPPFERQGVSDADLIDFTPELKASAREILGRYDHGPLFTPLGPRPTMVLPSWVGGANWGGAAVDPETGMLYVPSLTAVVSMALDPSGKRSDTGDGAQEIAGQASVVRGPGGMPLLKPPYGRITAIDLNRGEIAWSRPNGPGAKDMPAFAPYHPGWTGTTGRTGPLLTRTLLFLGEGPHSPVSKKVLRAYDKRTGEVRGEVALPDHTLGPPMTYMAAGRQFIVCGMGFRASPHRLVALALPAAPAGAPK